MQHINQKLLISVFAVLLFLIVSLPQTYKLTNKIFKNTSDEYGCPTMAGLAIHTVVFFVLVFGSMFIPWGKLKQKIGL